MEQSIAQWVNDPNRDYAEGVALFVSVGGNKHQARYFANTSPRFGMSKLLHELRKIAAKAEVSTVGVTDSAAPPTTTPAVPPIVDVAKKLIHETWVEMSRITEELYNLGTNNSEAVVAVRKALLVERLPLIERYNWLYEAKEAFFAGEIDEEKLRYIVEGKKEDPCGEGDGGGADEMTGVDFSSLSDLELKNRIHAARTAIRRYENQLLYQSNSEAEVENPMPDCPKRREVEEKLSVRKAEFESLSALWKERGLDGTT